jgi:nucleoside-diphosphate-sugar epimerase
MCADWRRAADVLDWEPRIKFSDGLAELIETSKMAAA